GARRGCRARARAARRGSWRSRLGRARCRLTPRRVPENVPPLRPRRLAQPRAGAGEEHHDLAVRRPKLGRGRDELAELVDEVAPIIWITGSAREGRQRADRETAATRLPAP